MGGSIPTIWKVSIDGGNSEKISDHAGLAPRVSPDGKWLMFQYADSPDPFAPPNKMVIMPFGVESERKEFPLPASGTASVVTQWSVDGKSIFFSIINNNTGNIWSQSIDGGPPKQVTDFKDSLITGFAWSNDGKQLAMTRGILLRDAVLITDQK